jgi:hypothetical protein
VGNRAFSAAVLAVEYVEYRMYCPKCAAQNLDNARFCRTCGADISFVSQALAGNIPQSSVAQYASSGHPLDATGPGRQKPPSLYKGIRSTFVGVGFLLVSSSIYMFAPAGRLWWFWLLITAFTNLGSGVAEMLRSKHEQRVGEPPKRPTIPPTQQPGELPPGAGQNPRPPSVTEGTTRILRIPSDHENYEN